LKNARKTHIRFLDPRGYPPDPLEEMGMIDTTNPNLDAHTKQISPGEDYITPDAGDKSRFQVSIWEDMVTKGIISHQVQGGKPRIQTFIQRHGNMFSSDYSDYILCPQ